jgi:hypothetical protein
MSDEGGNGDGNGRGQGGIPKVRRDRPRTPDDFTRRAKLRRKRTPDQILQDKALMAQYIHEGLYPGEIYKLVIEMRYEPDQRVRYNSFKEQLEQLRHEWKTTIDESMEDVQAQKIAEVRHLKRVYWAGYYRSLGYEVNQQGNPTAITNPYQVLPGRRMTEMQESTFQMTEIAEAKIKGRPPRQDTKKVKVKKQEEIGSEKWLQRVEWCIEMELKIRFGLKALSLGGRLPRGGRGGDDDEPPTPAPEQGKLPATGEEYTMPPEDIAGEQMVALFEEMKMVADKRRLLGDGRPSAEEQSPQDAAAVDADFEDVRPEGDG